MERKLTAMLCADVFGYSRLMGEDEEATIRNLSARRRIIDGLIEQHRGRFVNSAGDSVLAEFASAVNAVECAVQIQTALKTENADVPRDRRMEFRIGVNLGDVVVEGEQIYGDGVNVAARLESLAEPGGIYISASIREQIDNKLALSYEDLVEQGAGARLLLLYTARPEFHAPWPMRAHHAQINLNRLTSGNVRAMVAQVAAKIALSHETIATVVERTGGVPLFVEELTRAVLESGNAKLTGREIPATLHDSLMARLDRLGPAKELIQVGAVIGSEFSYELIHAVYPIAEGELQAALRRLTDAELLYVRGIAPEATYQFKHALIHDAAYEALLKSRRKEMHLNVARTIDEKFPALKEAHPEVLARHWTEAGEIEPAITQWQTAGERAVTRRAYHEGAQHYRNAIAILQNLPESLDRDYRELPLQVALGNVMQWTRGWSAAETVEAYTRAGVVADRSGGVESINIFLALCRAANLRGEPRAGLALADRALAIANRNGSMPALIATQSVRGFSHLVLGDLAGARQLFMQVMEYYNEEDFRGEAMPDDGFYAYIFAGHTEWYLGYPERAVRLVNEALSIARRQNNPFLTVFALAVGSLVYEMRRDYRRTFEAADEAVRLNIVSEFPFINATGGRRRAWSRA